MEKADLHIHTTASDGTLKPNEIVKWAYKKNVKAIAITDHDTVYGIDIAINEANKYNNLLVIPGIEFSCEYNDIEIHILGYFINYKSKILKKLTDKIIHSRKIRGEKIIKKLNKIGIEINIRDVENHSRNSRFIGRPHIARALIAKKYVNTINEAFEKYIGKDKPAYEPRYKLSINKAINVIHAIKGIAVLAHPGLIKDINPKEVFTNYKFDGIEVYHSKHKIEDIKKYEKLANEHNLIKTGGSDFHGEYIDGKPIIGNYYVQLENLKTDLKNKNKFYIEGV